MRDHFRYKHDPTLPLNGVEHGLTTDQTGKVKHLAGFPSEWGFLTEKALNPGATGKQRPPSPGTRAEGRQPPHGEARELVLAPALVPWRG